MRLGIEGRRVVTDDCGEQSLGDGREECLRLAIFETAVRTSPLERGLISPFMLGSRLFSWGWKESGGGVPFLFPPGDPFSLEMHCWPVADFHSFDLLKTIVRRWSVILCKTIERRFGTEGRFVSKIRSVWAEHPSGQSGLREKA